MVISYPREFLGEGPSSSWLQGTPCLATYREKEEFFLEILLALCSCQDLQWPLTCRHVLSYPGQSELCRFSLPLFFFLKKKWEFGKYLRESDVTGLKGRQENSIL